MLLGDGNVERHIIAKGFFFKCYSCTIYTHTQIYIHKQWYQIKNTNIKDRLPPGVMLWASFTLRLHLWNHENVSARVRSISHNFIINKQPHTQLCIYRAWCVSQKYFTYPKMHIIIQSSCVVCIIIKCEKRNRKSFIIENHMSLHM